jgi:hypothetical protein
MGEPACDVLEVEMALDLVEGELAAELPAHVRAFARAHADGRPPPGAPLVARLASTLQTARRACMHDVLADRGLALLRLAAPLAIESDVEVARARAATPSWDGLTVLAAARAAVARARFGTGAIELAHRLHGVDAVAAEGEPPEPGRALEHWQRRDGAVDPAAIDDVWQAIAARLGIAGAVRVDRASSPDIKPRTFVIEPRREVIVVVPAELGTPAARFAVLHELGHAAAALALPAGVPRVLDEAVASYIARLAEPPSWLPARWTSEHALPARHRRGAIATALDWIERALPDVRAPVGAAPPRALWHDPGAQAAYVAAEAIADRLQRDLGSNPPRGQLARVLGFERARIDRRTHV